MAEPKTFALALIKKWLRFGPSHTIVVDKVSKVRNVFAETVELLQNHIHVLSGENHDAMLVKRVNQFLNSSLTIFCKEYITTNVSEEGILMILYFTLGTLLLCWELIFLAVS